MHRISKVGIQNFKSIQEVELPLAAYTPLVGYKNAGNGPKTALTGLWPYHAVLHRSFPKAVIEE